MNKYGWKISNELLSQEIINKDIIDKYYDN
jgi:hypothetical protein